MKPIQKIGKKGDFYTSSMVSDVFGSIMADVMADFIENEKLAPVICEIGAGDGRFASSVLQAIKQKNKLLYADLVYIIIEKSPYHKELLQKLPDEKVQLYDSFDKVLKDWPEFNGVIFSNELLDAMPVHVIENNGGKIAEVFISIDENGGLIEKTEVCENTAILEWMEKYGPRLSDGQRIEVPLVMTDWLNRVFNWLERGFVITIDYGYRKKEWEHPARMEGSLRGYYKHQLKHDPLYKPGNMDLTAHVHLEALIEIGNEAGLKTIGDIPQGDYLIKNGLWDYLQNVADSDPFSEAHKQNRAVRTLGSLNDFQVIVQQKE
ncbi:class I SAM-dependent methyltransferase [Pseudalkalibacillus caeni]|nr:class I SAM-dependent methyltransferase [Pseudalkalibacillus caeni]